MRWRLENKYMKQCKCNNLYDKEMGYCAKTKAIQLLNEVVNTVDDLTPEQINNEQFLLDGDVVTEIYNFLNNWDLFTKTKELKVKRIY